MQPPTVPMYEISIPFANPGVKMPSGVYATQTTTPEVSQHEPKKHSCVTGDRILVVRFEGFTAVIMKNGVFWDVTPCGSC
jgi:hypothetical protein